MSVLLLLLFLRVVGGSGLVAYFYGHVVMADGDEWAGEGVAAGVAILGEVHCQAGLSALVISLFQLSIRDSRVGADDYLLEAGAVFPFLNRLLIPIEGRGHNDHLVQHIRPDVYVIPFGEGLYPVLDRIWPSLPEVDLIPTLRALAFRR